MWLIAWDRYSLAAVAVDHQLNMDQAMLHKEVVLSIACAAPANGRSELLGVLYDELARFEFVLCLASASKFVDQDQMGGSIREAGREL